MIGGRNPNAWNNWYHVCGSTYGSWPRGDARGFRTFHHRQHVEGDYRNPPPPGVYAPIFEYTRKIMRYPPVKLSIDQRRLLCEAMTQRLREDDVEVLALAVAVNHFHLLGRFPEMDARTIRDNLRSILHDGRDPAPRHFLGRARKHASMMLFEKGLKPASPVWGVRPKCEPVRDRSHQVNTLRYAENHVVEGAVVHSFRYGLLLPTR